jgi:pimeloyl-ACP methyl ester carboxylesterase
LEFTPIQRMSLSAGPLAYRQTGSGMPVLLIHGWRGSSRHWQDTMDHLADCRAVYAIDLPGHGETPAWSAAITTEGLAQLALEFADRLGLGRFDLVGHSFGAAVAIALAAQSPGRVRRLILTSLGTARSEMERYVLTQTHRQMSVGLDIWRPWLAMARPWNGYWQAWADWVGSQPAVSRAIAGAFLQHLPDDDAVICGGVAEFLSADPLSALEVAICAGSPAILPALARITAPALVVSGASDAVMPMSGVKALAERLADSRLAAIEACGHIPMIEQPEGYHWLVREFLLNGE